MLPISPITGPRQGLEGAGVASTKQEKKWSTGPALPDLTPHMSAGRAKRPGANRSGGRWCGVMLGSRKGSALRGAALCVDDRPGCRLRRSLELHGRLALLFFLLTILLSQSILGMPVRRVVRATLQI